MPLEQMSQEQGEGTYQQSMKKLLLFSLKNFLDCQFSFFFSAIQKLFSMSLTFGKNKLECLSPEPFSGEFNKCR